MTALSAYFCKYETVEFKKICTVKTNPYCNCTYEINLEEDLQEIPKETKEMSSQGSIRIINSSGDFDDDNVSENEEENSKDDVQKEDELSDAETTSQSTIKASPSMTTMDSVDVSGSYDQANDTANVPSDRFRKDLLIHNQLINNAVFDKIPV